MQKGLHFCFAALKKYVPEMAQKTMLESKQKLDLRLNARRWTARPNDITRIDPNCAVPVDPTTNPSNRRNSSLVMHEASYVIKLQILSIRIRKQYIPTLANTNISVKSRSSKDTIKWSYAISVNDRTLKTTPIQNCENPRLKSL